MAQEPDEGLTPLAKKVLEVFEHSPDQWLSRGNIAAALGRKRLNPHDIQLLDELIERGMIIGENRLYATVATRWEYKLKK